MCVQADSEQQAREVCSSRSAASKIKKEHSKLRQIHLSAGVEGEAKDVVPLIIKADVAGSVEVLAEVLRNHQPDQVNLNVVYTGVGAVTESDVEMADSTQGCFLYKWLVSSCDTWCVCAAVLF